MCALIATQNAQHAQVQENYLSQLRILIDFFVWFPHCDCIM